MHRCSKPCFWCSKPQLSQVLETSDRVQLVTLGQRYHGQVLWDVPWQELRKQKRLFQQVPTDPTTRTRTRTQMDELDRGEVGGWMRRSELCVREKTVSHLLRLVARHAWIWVWKWGAKHFVRYFINVEGQWGLEKQIVLKFYSQVHWILCPRSWVEFEYHESLYSNSTHHKSVSLCRLLVWLILSGNKTESHKTWTVTIKHTQIRVLNSRP